MIYLNRRITAAVVSSLVFAGGADAGFQAIVMQGQSAPDTGGGTYGNLLSQLSVDESGEVTFWSTLNGVPSGFDTAAFRSVDGVIQKIIQKGDEAPGLPGKTFRQTSALNYSASGALAINLRLDTTNEGVNFDNDWGLWADTGSGLEQIAQEGSVAPHTGGGLFEQPSDPILSPGGDLAFIARLKEVGDVNSENNSALWRKSKGGSLELLAREGMLSPGVDGGEFQFMNVPSINSSATTAFSASIRTVKGAPRGGIDSSNDFGLWKAGSDGMMDLVLRAGDEAIGVEGFVFTGFSRPLINESGELSIIAGMTDPNADARGFGETGVWSSSGGVFEKIATTQDIAPGAGGVKYRSFLWSAFNDQGDVAFGAYIDDPVGARGTEPPEGHWKYSDGEIETIAVTGDTAPDTDGANFESFTAPAMNNRGDIVFRASLAIEGDVTFDTRSGIWAYVAPGEGRGVGMLIKVARTGDEFEVAPGDIRVIDFVDVQGLDVEGFEPAPVLSDAGLLAIRLSFTDGTGGLFLFQVPAPGSGSLLIVAAMTAIRRRR